MNLIPTAPKTGELPMLDESDECTEIFSSSMLAMPEERTSPSLPVIEVAAPADESPTRPVPPLEPPRMPLPSITSSGFSLGGSALPPPRKPLPGMDFDDVTHVKPPVPADDDASPILLSRRKSNPPPAPAEASVSAVSRSAVKQAQRAQQSFFSRILSLLWN